MACGMISLQFVGMDRIRLRPSNLWHQRSGLRRNRLYDRPGSIPMRAVSTALAVIGQFWRGICNLSLALMACENRRRAGRSPAAEPWSVFASKRAVARGCPRAASQADREFTSERNTP